ncbi:MAG: AMP-binding protein [Pseudomonadota bacterium]|nr:AMP-binding protein [Pseudomonadota bacterium]
MRPDTKTVGDADTLIRVLSEMMNEMGRTVPENQESILHASFDRDLGFDSLARMELVHRAERQFKVTLADDVIGRAETPAELLRAIGGATGTPAIRFVPTGAPPMAPKAGGIAPNNADTLDAVLAWHAEAHPDRVHIHLLSDSGTATEITYGALWTHARAVAAEFLGMGLQPGEPIILMLPTSLDYFRIFFGALLAGGVPVPVYPPGRAQQLEEHVQRHGAIIANARAPIMITVPEAVPFARLLMTQAGSLRRVVTPAELEGAEMPAYFPVPAPGDTAFIQYTSGSTGDPKGVTLNHANLLSNIRAMGTHLEATPEDVFVSWLPLYHDMGLIGAWLGSLTYGMPLVLMPPLAFLARPERWLWAISNFKGTLSGGPNFAFEACFSRIGEAALEGCDLSTWRVAFCGAEPISVPTLEAFMDRFATNGFARRAMMPVYGLAENSVGLTFPPVGREPVFDRIDRQRLLRTGEAEITTRDDNAVLTLPSCGYPLYGHQVRIVDDARRELPDRRQGSIQFKGPSSSIGYLHNADATRNLFDGTWLNTGDLGYSVGGEIYITGRTKDMIIRSGRNIHPAEIEAGLGKLDGIRSGAVAVFGIPNSATGTERLVVMAETRQRDAAARLDLERCIIGRTSELAGLPPDQVLLVPPRSVPKTSSGKIRRNAARQLYEMGRLGSGPDSLRWQKFRISLSAIAMGARRSIQRFGHWVFAGYAGVAFLLVVPLAWLGVAILPSLNWRWRLVRGALAILFTATRIKVTTDGPTNFRQPRRVILTCNHSSYLDAAVLGYALGVPLCFVAKAELTKNFVMRILLSRLGTQFVERFDAAKSVADVGKIQRQVTDGRHVVFFPEGTLSRIAGLLPFQTGAFQAAVETGASIKPIVIRGSRHVLRDGTYIPRPGHILVRLLEPLEAEPVPDAERGGTWLQAVALRDRCRVVILENCGEPDLRRENVLLGLAREQSGAEFED